MTSVDLGASTPPLKPGSCHVWWARPADASPRFATLLDRDERDRWQALRRPADRDRFLVACGLIRLALAEYLARPPTQIAILRACAECGKPHGKPRLAPPLPGGVEFSVSHSGDRVVVAFAHGTPLGVDVEQVRSGIAVNELAAEVLTAREAETLRGLESDDRTVGFFVYWTRKEAVAKATGRGLAVGLRSFGVSGPRDPARLVWAHDPELARQVSLHDLDPGAGHVASLAVIGHCRHIVARDGSALLARYLAQVGE